MPVRTGAKISRPVSITLDPSRPGSVRAIYKTDFAVAQADAARTEQASARLQCMAVRGNGKAAFAQATAVLGAVIRKTVERGGKP